MKATPLDDLGFPKHELLEDGTIRQVTSGRILSKRTDKVNVCYNNTHKSYLFAKVLYCATHGIHISKLKGKNTKERNGKFFTPETATVPPPGYSHYVGDLDFIGLPDYALYMEGLYKKSTRSIQWKDKHQKRVDHGTYALITEDGEEIRMSVKKLQWCADNGVHYSKIHGHGVSITPDGHIMQQDDYCRWLNDRYRVKKIDTVVGQKERIRRLDVVQKETEMLRHATLTDDYSQVAAYLATLEGEIMRYVWKYARQFNAELRKAIWSYTYDAVLILARNGMICGHSIEHTAKIVAHKASFQGTRGDRKGGALIFTDAMLRKLHNPDDEMPYQYD